MSILLPLIINIAATYKSWIDLVERYPSIIHTHFTTTAVTTNMTQIFMAAVAAKPASECWLKRSSLSWIIFAWLVQMVDTVCLLASLTALETGLWLKLLVPYLIQKYTILTAPYKQSSSKKLLQSMLKFKVHRVGISIVTGPFKANIMEDLK